MCRTDQRSLQSPYSIFAGVTCLPQKISFPFSLVSFPENNIDGVSPALNLIRPGWVLHSNAYMLDRNSSKFSKRRKSIQYSTDADIFRPSIIKLMIKARTELQHLLSEEKYPVDKSFFTEKDCLSIGKNILMRSDILPAITSYTNSIRRFALTGLIKYVNDYYLSNKDNNLEKKAIIESILEIMSHRNNFDVIGGLFDLSQFDIYKDPGDISCASFDLLYSLKVYTDEFSALSCGMSIIDDLMIFRCLEEEHANNISICRMRDNKRGIQVIDDYEDVHEISSNDLTITNAFQKRDSTIKVIEKLISLF